VTLIVSFVPPRSTWMSVLPPSIASLKEW